MHTYLYILYKRSKLLKKGVFECTGEILFIYIHTSIYKRSKIVEKNCFGCAGQRDGGAKTKVQCNRYSQIMDGRNWKSIDNHFCLFFSFKMCKSTNDNGKKRAHPS